MSECQDCLRLCRLVGWEDSPWESVEQMADDLREAAESMALPTPAFYNVTAAADLLSAAVVQSKGDEQ